MSEGPNLWCAATAEQLVQIASAHWRNWPRDEGLRTTGSLDVAIAAARELAQAHGAGHVVQFAVTPELLARYPRGQVPPEGRDELLASLRHAISEYAHYRGGLPEAEFEAAKTALGQAIPATWRSYLQNSCWFYRGWMRTGAYVWLYPPAMSAELSSDALCPGMFVIGGDGASEQLVVDLRDQSPRVMLANVVRTGWQETFVQAPSLTSFLAKIEAGTFEFAFS
jgi:hypothetical protein